VILLETYESFAKREKAPFRTTKERLRRLVKRYAGLFWAGKFAVGSAVGFLDTEIILVAGTYLLWGKVNPPQGSFSSPAFLTLNAIAFGVGVTVAFLVNETLMLRNPNTPRMEFSLRSIMKRLIKFHLIFLTGNVIIVVVQLLLLKEFSVPPIFGNIVGAIVSFPASYFFSMHFVWEIDNTGEDRRQAPEKIGQLSDSLRRAELSRDEIEKILRRFPILNESYDIKIDEYKFDLDNNRENETTIDFGIRLNVMTEKVEH